MGALRKTPAWLLVAILVTAPDPGDSVTIYRFGGAALPPPAEATEPGVVFRQMDWADLSLLKGGESTRVEMDEQSISPRQHNPRTNIAPEKLAGDLHADIDTFVEITRNNAASDDPHAAIVAELYDHLDRRLDRHGCQLSQEERHRLLDPDIELNAQGLEYWLDHAMRA